MTTAQILLDEHVGRVFERLLRERGHEVKQAKDRFGESTTEDRLRPPSFITTPTPPCQVFSPGQGGTIFAETPPCRVFERDTPGTI
ncbi:hypothetical protein DJ68_11400 [Halorubrum sp. C3]|nr:hypothetical protein DJ68_11400 [Halorubrum sp. C3]